MDHAVSEIRSEDLSQLRLLEHKADRMGWGVGLPLKFLLEFYEVFLQVIFKPEGVEGISLIPPASEILPVAVYTQIYNFMDISFPKPNRSGTTP